MIFFLFSLSTKPNGRLALCDYRTCQKSVKSVSRYFGGEIRRVYAVLFCKRTDWLMRMAISFYYNFVTAYGRKWPNLRVNLRPRCQKSHLPGIAVYESIYVYCRELAKFQRRRK